MQRTAASRNAVAKPIAARPDDRQLDSLTGYIAGQSEDENQRASSADA